jgi:hypothetical protein
MGTSNSQPVGNAKAQPAAQPQFIPLSQLSQQQASLKDLSGLLPAAIISLVLNTALVIGLLWSNSGRAGAGEIQTVTTEARDETAFNDKEMIDIEGDPNALGDEGDPISPIDVNIPAAAPMLPTEDNKKTEPGSAGDNQGFAGADDPSGALIGQYLGPDVKVGFRGDQGGGPMGEGSGLGGLGGGVNLPGGVGDREAGRRSAGRFGATNESEKAVALGLTWLAKHQAGDGRWSLDKYHQHAAGCNCKGPDEKPGANDTAATALGLLPFLGAGQTHKKGSFQKHIHAGLRFLISKQNSNSGDLGGGMYSHGLASIALCEAYAMTKDQVLRDGAQRAINFIAGAQNKTNGGWRYTPRAQDGDTSVVAWQVMALRSGQMAGLNVPAPALQGAKKWLDSCAKDGGSKYSYTPDAGAAPAMTAAGLLNRQYLGWGIRTPELHKGCQYMLQNLPPAKAKPDDKLGPIYYYYYAAQVMHHMGGDYWNKWNPLCRDFLIATQQKEGHKAGSWNAEGADWGVQGGRMYTTSLSILTLEVYYRHLPLYRREAGLREGEGDQKPEMEKKEMEKPAEKK